MALLASANLDALKSKDFRDTLLSSIDKAGRWAVYTAGVLSVGLMGAFGALDPETALVAIGVLMTSATGIEIVLTNKKGKPDGKE
jgi:hypothetical protein